MLPRCVDPPPSRLPNLNCAAIPDEGGFSYNGTEVREHLCPMLDRLLGFKHYEKQQPLRFVSTNSNNGWAALVAAVYLQRTHGTAPFLGLAVNDFGTEHATTRNIRALLLQVGLSWRATSSFDAAADAALLTYFPQVRNPLWPTASAPARTLLPMAWVGTPPPFDVCFRMGEHDEAALLEDVGRLGGFCRHLAFGGRPSAAVEKAFGAGDAPSQEAGGHHARAVVSLGGFTVLSSRGVAVSADFAFVNKTPPSAHEFFKDECMRDMAPCGWHKGVPP